MYLYCELTVHQLNYSELKQQAQTSKLNKQSSIRKHGMVMV